MKTYNVKLTESELMLIVNGLNILVSEYITQSKEGDHNSYLIGTAEECYDLCERLIDLLLHRNT